MSAPELFYTHEKHLSFDNNGDQFAIDDYLNFHNEDNEEQETINVVNDGVVADNVNANGNSTHSSTITLGDSSNNNNSSLARCDDIMKDVQFSGELVVHQDDLAELEWVSTFQEESFSGEELQKMQLISGIMPQTSNSIRIESNGKNNENSNDPIFVSDVQVPAKAKRSKRPRIAPCDWKSRLVAISDKSQPTQDVVLTAQPQQLHAPIKRANKRKDTGDNGEGRKCLHCATDKTPQWRTGPLGPKTLCNACGVRYKSGRLVPEYRPAASPTFVLTKHSNSHRKVMELRRQKELKTQVQHMQNEHHQQQQVFLHEQQQGIFFDVHNGEDYLIHQHMGVEFESLVDSYD